MQTTRPPCALPDASFGAISPVTGPLASLGAPHLPLALAGGSLVILGFMLLGVVVIGFSFYSRRGSGISQTPYADLDGASGPEMPSELAHDRSQHVTDWSRGTGGSHHAQRGERLAVEPKLAARLERWRDGVHVGSGRLAQPVMPSDHARGPEQAPLTVVSYADFMSPDCARAASMLAGLRTELGAERVRLVHRHFPLADAHAGAAQAAQASEVAASTGRFWEFHDALFGDWRGEPLADVAQEVGVDPTRIESELAAHTHLERILSDIDGGASSGVNGVPTLFINGARYEGELDEGPLRAALVQTLGRAGTSPIA